MQFKRIKGDLFQQKGGIKVIPVNGNYDFLISHKNRIETSVRDAFFKKHDTEEYKKIIAPNNPYNPYTCIEYIMKYYLFESKQISKSVRSYNIGHFSFIEIEEETYCFLVSYDFDLSTSISGNYEASEIRCGIRQFLEFLRDCKNNIDIFDNSHRLDFINKHFPDNTPIDLYLPVIGTLNAADQFINDVENLVKENLEYKTGRDINVTVVEYSK